MKYKTDTSFLNKQGKVNTFEMNTVYFFQINNFLYFCSWKQWSFF